MAAPIGVSNHHDSLMAIESRPGELHAIAQCTSMMRIGRKDMHQHVVLGQPVVSLKPQELTLDVERPLRQPYARIALLTWVGRIWHRGVDLKVTLGRRTPRLAHHQGVRFHLRVRSDAGAECQSASLVYRDGCRASAAAIC